MTLSLPVSEIVVENRQRALNEEHVSSLADSMRDLGLIQPIIINQHKRLIAGGHRLAAAKKLGWVNIFVVYRETMTDDEFAELELTENIKRKDNTWQETCLAIAKIHYLKVKRNALDSKKWGQRDTGALLNVNQADVTYSLIIAKELINDSTKSNEFWKAENFTAAYALLVKRNEDEALARLANQQTTSVFDMEDDDVLKQDGILNIEEEEIDLTTTPVDYRERSWNSLSYDEAKVRYLSNPLNPPDQFDEYWKEKIDAMEDARNKIPLLKRYIKGDSIVLMNSDDWKGRFDHVITDIPFGIDIEMIDQSNSIHDIDTIKAEHTVEGNMELHAQFFPAAFNCLKEQGFCITWCDIMQWQRMYDLATTAGFKVTRWPFVWVKTYPCLNQMAQYNFTKSVEFAMVCRKGTITLPEKQHTCHILAERDDICDAHPFAKPFACWERLITAVSIQNQSILDPFCGSGSAFISGVRLGRVMFGVEKDEKLFNAGLENLKQFYLTLNPKAYFV